MPNWCNNLVEVAGPKEVMEVFRKTEKGQVGPISFMKAYPPPNNLYNLDWCSNSWGTKWDIDDTETEIVYESATQLIIRFTSAWAPPEGVFEHLSQKYRELYFAGIYAEAGMDFSGKFEFGPEPVEDVEENRISNITGMISFGISVFERLK